jgi:hypothetical protein
LDNEQEPRIRDTDLAERLGKHTYSVSFTSNENVNADSYNGDLSLNETIETCKQLNTTATLYDENGCVRGWVKADGSYKLQ